MATYVKGNAVANATSYELLEKETGGTYKSLETKNEINFEVSALGLDFGDHTLVVKAHADGYESSDPSNEVVYEVVTEDSKWLSNAISGETGKHDEFMNATDLSAQLTVGYDVIFYTSEVQSAVEGKAIYRVACGNLGSGGTLTLYSNPWAASGTLSTEGRTVIGTIVADSDEETAGSEIKVYTVLNPAPVKAGETVAIAWSNKLQSVANGTITGYTTPAKYKKPSDNTYTSLINSFNSFDLFLVGE